MSRIKLLAMAVSLLMLSSGTAVAGGIKAQPFSFDPDGVGCGTGAWVTGQGLPDAGRSNHALYTTKFCATSTNAAGGATISGVEGQQLIEIGWDVRDDGHCGAGAPRFLVVTADGVFHFIGCNSPTPIINQPAPGSPDANGNTWTRKRYDPSTAFPPIPSGPQTDANTIQQLFIVFDEGTDSGPGYAYIDNIDVNGTLIQKPGNA